MPQKITLPTEWLAESRCEVDKFVLGVTGVPTPAKLGVTQAMKCGEPLHEHD